MKLVIQKIPAIQMLILIFVLSGNTYAQKTDIQAGLKIPLTYSLALEYQFHKNISVFVQTNLLMTPFDKAILDILEAFDSDEIILNTIGEAFSYGYEFQPGIKFWLGKYYAGLNYSYFTLIGNESPVDAIENYYGISIPDRLRIGSNDLKLKLMAHNAGILFGRKFNLKNPKTNLRLQLSTSKIFSSKSELSGDNGIYPNLSTAIDKELGGYILEYGYLPSLDFYFSYTLGE